MKIQRMLSWTAVLSAGLAMGVSAAENGLVAHFTFDDPANFGYDKVQKTVIGTIYKTNHSSAEDVADPTSCDAPFVKGMKMAGGWWQNNYMSVPGSSFGSAQGIPYGNAAVTYSLWIKPMTTWHSGSVRGEGTSCYLLRHSTVGHEWYKNYDHENIYIAKDGSTGFPKIVFAVGEFMTAAASATYTLDAAFDGGWHLLTATYTNRVLKLYWDGVKRAETELASNVGVPDNSALTLGSAAVGYDEFVQHRYGGAVDELKVYNRALGDDEILAAYNAGATAYDTDVLVWNGAAAGGAVETMDNWSTKSNRRTLETVYADGAVFDVTAVEDGGAVTQTADATLKIRGAICTNGQDEVTLRLQDGSLAMPRPVQRGLVTHLSFDDPGNRYLDYSPNGFTAEPGSGRAAGSNTLTGLTGTPGISADGLWFENGFWLFDYFKIPGTSFNSAHGIPYGNQAVSFSFWIKPVAAWRDYDHLGLGSNGLYLLRHGESSCQWIENRGHSFWIFKDGVNPKITWSVANGGLEAERTTAYTSTELFDGEWHHIVGTYESDHTLKLYFDGELKATTIVPNDLSVANNSTLTIGADGLASMNDSVQRTYAGGFDELKVFNVALTAEEVAAEYASHSRYLYGGTAGTSPSPVRLQLDAGTTAEVRGFGHEYGTLAGAGSVDIGYTSALTLDGAFALTGALTGVGELTAANLVLGGNTSAYIGDFTLRENAEITVTDGNNAFLNSTFGGKVKLPKKAVITYGGKRPSQGTATLAAGTLVPPSDFTEWTDSTGGRVKVTVAGNTLTIKVVGGIIIYVR